MTEKKMTAKERRWCFRHAKEHVIEAIDDAAGDEHHSVISIDGVMRGDLMDRVARDMLALRRLVRKAKASG